MNSSGIIILLSICLIFFVFSKRKSLFENFQNNNEPKKNSEESIESILGDLEIDLSKFTDKEGEIKFSELPLDKLDNKALDGILNKMGKATEENSIILDIERANLLRREIMKRKLLNKQASKYEELKKRNKKIEEFSRGEVDTLIDKCYLQEHSYNLGGDTDKYNLEYTSHPVKWYGLETRIKNVFPANYAFV